jgi:hypothetical protein
MPSPFPGVDPYVEAVENWSDFHARFIYLMATTLGPMIRPRYHARIERHEFTLDREEREFIPDVMVLQASARPQGNTAALAVMEADTALLVEEPLPQERQGFIQIFDKQSGNRIVTQIELLSPTNKSSKGLDQYRQKQREVLHSQVHLVEIDMLCRGLHALAVPEELLTMPTGFHSFFVSVNRYPRRDQHQVYALTLKDRLPRIRVPLSVPDPDVVLDLSAVYSRAYDEALYCDTLTYLQDPPHLRLSTEERTWLDQHPRQQGKR